MGCRTGSALGEKLGTIHRYRGAEGDAALRHVRDLHAQEEVGLEMQRGQ